ncbi:hypothetical protein MTR67_009751 [Solanum verrucosum]|uniref:RING-type E3 ubiquitin transferase n=1 Tax=Solanum verrucosum TaxID=315347 RepID=A0AAF0Q3X0_SOLVR|nr:hypothetical protein MTR67_009751 [Solanum verrucosum]
MQDSWCKNDGPIVHFPFRLSHQPKHCGYPGFELHCNNKNDTILELPSTVHLAVEKIEYVSQKIHLYDPDQCIAAKLPKLNLVQSNFTNDDDLTVLFNCPAPLADYIEYDFVPCLGSSNYKVYAVSWTFSLQLFLSWPCTKNHQYPYSHSTFGENMLQLNWSVPLCENCESKGMDYGFKDGTNLLETHCFNRIITRKGTIWEEFINEIGTIGRIHHVNVVRLLGFCADGFRRALIHEYLPNDSLGRLILPVSSCPGSVSLISWNKLQHIALGTARGIEYLHQGCDQQILHFDI